MTNVRLCLLFVLIAAWPGSARAQGWWDFLEELSGPGPFYGGVTAVLKPVCFVEKTPGRDDRVVVGWWGKGPAGDYPCLVKSKSVHSYVEVRVGHARTDDKPLFSDVQNQLLGRAGANLVEGLVMRQLDPAVSIGAGAGVLWFSGSVITSAVPMFTATPISVSVTPFRLTGAKSRWSRLVVFRFEEIAIFGTTRAKDFNSASQSTFVANTEVKRSFGIDFDVLSLLKP
jgi:hypothetical protein